MKNEEKVREFFVKKTRVRNGLASYTATIAPINVAGEIHVIEKSAFDALKAERDEIVNRSQELSKMHAKLIMNKAALKAAAMELRGVLETQIRLKSINFGEVHEALKSFDEKVQP